jgi:GTP pyrophosphokinase
MLERIKAVLETYSTVSSFEVLVHKHFASDVKGHVLVMRALRLATREHKGESRLDGKPVLSHPIAIAVILMVILNEKSPDVIAAALLHLFIEEVPGWNFDRLHMTFGFKVASHVWFVSKTTRDDEKKWVLRTQLSHNKLLHAEASTQMLKLCDRLNNLLSIKFLPVWKQKRMLRDTVDFYVPLSSQLGVLEEALLEAIKEASRAE